MSFYSGEGFDNKNMKNQYQKLKFKVRQET